MHIFTKIKQLVKKDKISEDTKEFKTEKLKAYTNLVNRLKFKNKYVKQVMFKLRGKLDLDIVIEAESYETKLYVLIALESESYITPNLRITAKKMNTEEFTYTIVSENNTIKFWIYSPEQFREIVNK